jgi:hypothetical protein
MNWVGIVSFVEASASPPIVEAYRVVARQSKLTARAHISLYLNPALDEITGRAVRPDPAADE